MKKMFLALLVAALLVSPALAQAEEKEESDIAIMSEIKLPWELNTWLVKTICVEGKVFLVSYVLGRQAGAAVHSTQVMEEKNGRSVPMKCDPDDYKDD
ncbi:MAG: hypothetical protein JRI97_06855 [Deltaproteobacteria bacterium]|nr:hypothetical protein [Deltaproteobacteria bacterium]